MTDDERKVLMLSPNKTQIFVTAKATVGMHLKFSPNEAMAPPTIDLAMELAPNEAREIARALLRKADEAEGTGSTPHGGVH